MRISSTMEALLLVLGYCILGFLSVNANYAPAPDNVVIAAPHRHTDTLTNADGDDGEAAGGDTEYPTNEEVLADPEIRDNVLRNYNRKVYLKQRLHAIIIPESESDIVIDANIQGLSDKEIKELQSLAFDSVHKVMRIEFNDSDVRYTENRFSDRGVGNPNDDVTNHVKKQRILIPKKRFPRVPLKEVSRGFQAMQLPDKFEDYDVTDVDGRISLKELMQVTGTVENLMEAFAAFDKNGDGFLSPDEFEIAPWIRRPDIEI